MSNLAVLPDSAKALVAFSQSEHNKYDLQAFETKEQLQSLFEQACSSHIKSGIQIGFYALELKKTVKHGEFQDMLDSVGKSYRTISEYMNIAKTVLNLSAKSAETALLESKETSQTDKNSKTVGWQFALQRFSSQEQSKQISLSSLPLQLLLYLNDDDWNKVDGYGVVETKGFVKQKKEDYGLTGSAGRENILENKYLKSKEENQQLKHQLELAEGKRTNIDPNVFYYAKQSTLLVEEASQVALGFEEILNEFHLDTDPAKAKIWEKVAVDLFMSYQGALAKFLASFNRIKAAIPPEFQTEQSARINAYDEEMILEMSSVLDTYRASTYAKPQLRQHVALTAAKKVK